MLRLRAGLLAVFIAAFTCVGVVGAQVANADPTPAELEFMELTDPGPITWGEADNHDWNYWRQVIFGRDAEINNALTATTKSPLTSLTGIEVKAPSTVDAPMLGNLCKSGYGCTIAGIAGTAMAAAGLLGLEGGQVDTERSPINEANFHNATQHPVQLYGSARVSKCADFIDLDPYPGLWDAGGVSPAFGFRVYGQVKSRPDFVFGCGMNNVPVAFDCHKNGTWIHTNAVLNASTGAVGTNFSVGMAYPCGTTNTKDAGWELRRVHFDQTAPGDVGQNQGFEQGFYWGVSDPLTDGTMRATTQCQRPNGTFYTVVGASLPVATGKVDVKPCAVGDKPLWVQTDHILADGTTVEPQSVQNIARAAPPDWAPDCKTAGSGCRWVVKVGNVPCTIGQAGCTDWTEHKEDAECFYGPYGMPLESCNLLERAYEPQPVGTKMPATRPNWDGNPTTTTGPARITTPTVAPSPTPTPPAQTSGDTDPTTRPSPSPSGTTTPAPEAPGGSGAPNPSDTAGRSCFPNGWAAFNPVQWVLKPIRCALEPDPAKTKARVDSLRARLDGKGPGPMIAAVSAVVEQAGDAGGCAGPNMPFHIGDVQQDIHPFSACAEPMATAAQYVKALATVVIVIGGGLAVTRAVASGFGFSFTMGKGANDGD